MDPLAGFSKLKMLSLIGNPVTTKPNYRQVELDGTAVHGLYFLTLLRPVLRLYVIAKCKSLKILDFKKVKLQVRAMDDRPDGQRIPPCKSL